MFSIGGYSLIATVLLLNLTFVRLDCPSVLLTQCNRANSVQNYLDNPFPHNVNLNVRCGSQPGLRLRGWSLSPNGTEPDARMIDTSLAKYTASDNTLNIHGVNASDEGVYRCVYETGNVTRLCVLVYARAAFASCPSSSGGCSDPENITVTVGESINFNVSIVFIGGSCGFKQDIERIELKRCLNNNCTTGSSLLRSSQTPEGINLLTSTLEDSGLYQVIVRGRHPNGSGSTSIEKKYWVTVDAPPTTTTTSATTTTTNTTQEQETTTEEGGTTKAAAMVGTSSGRTPTTVKAQDGTTTGSPIMITVIIVSTTLALAVICPLTIIVVLCTRKKYIHSCINGRAALRKNTDGFSGQCERGTNHSSEFEGTDRSSEGSSSTVSLINENANDVHSSNERERREPESDACANGSVPPHSTSEDQEVLQNPMRNLSQEALERSDCSSQASDDDDSSPRQPHPVDNSAHMLQPLTENQQGNEPLNEDDSAGEPLIRGEQTENERDGGACALPHSSAFNDNQENLEVFTNLTSQEASTGSDASSQTSNEDNSTARQVCKVCHARLGVHMPPLGGSQQESQRVENTLHQSEDAGEPQQGPSQGQQIRRQQLRLDLRSSPAIQDLMNEVAARTPAKWMVLGIQLGIETVQLDALDNQHRGKSDNIYADIFNRWKKKVDGKPKTWSTIIDALKTPSVDEVALAHNLESMSKIPDSISSTISMDSSHSWQQPHCTACSAHDE